ncbi:hypothetical protein Taro_018874 [Colocasia esculenta]|uniref:EF-hand domain-containing protein n=1 Tax=Colocasia esculenta TaxID=4460 RepID=A0A843UUW5_COLES|nr:hypothetical protein [Colocasia esculenta]
MAMAGAPPCNPAQGRAPTSFRLRNPSLNSIRLRRVFDLFDRNGDGEITVEELNQALSRLGLEADSEELRSTVSAFAKPGRGSLEYEDFESLHRALGDSFFGDLAAAAEGSDEEADAASAESDLKEAFSVFDVDGDGFISERELQTVLKKLGLAEGGDIARVHEMICAVDDNRDGRVDFSDSEKKLGFLTSILLGGPAPSPPPSLSPALYPPPAICYLWRSSSAPSPACGGELFPCLRPWLAAEEALTHLGFSYLGRRFCLFGKGILFSAEVIFSDAGGRSIGCSEARLRQFPFGFVQVWFSNDKGHPFS